MARNGRAGARDRQIGQEIVRRRKAAELTQESLGALVGLSHQMIAKYESGRSSLTVTLWEQIDRAIDDHRPPQNGLSEPASTFRAPPVGRSASEELLQSAEMLEKEARQLRLLAAQLQAR